MFEWLPKWQFEGKWWSPQIRFECRLTALWKIHHQQQEGRLADEGRSLALGQQLVNGHHATFDPQCQASKKCWKYQALAKLLSPLPKLKLGNGHLQKSQKTQNVNFCCCKDRSQSLSYFVPKSSLTSVASIESSLFCETYQIKKSKDNPSPRSVQKIV